MPHFVRRSDDSVKALFERLGELGFKICILSNGRESRVRYFMEDLPYLYVFRAKKPLLSGVNKALSLCESVPGAVAVIGDQIFTDIWVGKRKKICTVLVKPISGEDEFFVMLKRYLEKPILYEIKKRFCSD